MSVKENKALVRRFYKLLNRRELDAAYELVAPDCVMHFPTGNVPREQSKQFDVVLGAAFPDCHATIRDIVAEGDKVAFQVSWQGAHTGPFMGVAPTGKKYEMTNTYIVKIRADKLAEIKGTTHLPLMMQQLGVIPKQ
jgi:predicted ester cyclase